MVSVFMNTDKLGSVIWFTGLSGSGKTTLCSRLAKELLAANCRLQVLDGDIMRKSLCRDLGFTDDDRLENNRRIGYVARLLSNHGITVLVATISPLTIMRDFARSINPRYFEVFVSAPLEVCEERDPKGLYRRSRSGEIPNFTGVGSRYEIPTSPDVICDTATYSVEACVQLLLKALVEKDAIEPLPFFFDRTSAVANCCSNK